MNARTALLAVAYAAFLVLSVVATAQHGYLGIFAVGLRDTASAQVFADLCFALLIASRWLYADARSRGLSPWPWLLAIPLLGSISPVTYWLLRELRPVADGPSGP